MTFYSIILDLFKIFITFYDFKFEFSTFLFYYIWYLYEKLQRKSIARAVSPNFPFSTRFRNFVNAKQTHFLVFSQEFFGVSHKNFEGNCKISFLSKSSRHTYRKKHYNWRGYCRASRWNYVISAEIVRKLVIKEKRAQ